MIGNLFLVHVAGTMAMCHYESRGRLALALAFGAADLCIIFTYVMLWKGVL